MEKDIAFKLVEHADEIKDFNTIDLEKIIYTGENNDIEKDIPKEAANEEKDEKIYNTLNEPISETLVLFF
jgi:hypothetical protein